MGIAVARKKLKAKATAPVPAPGQVEQRIEQISARPELGEKGLDGIGNFGGDLQAEANTELIRELAYGRSGTRTWGEWEKRTRTDPAAAMALDFVLAPVRDARGDVTPADETPAAQQQADFIRWALFENLAPGWAEVTQQSVRGSLGCGFAVHELVWGEVEHPTLPGGRGVTVVELAERLPSSMSNNAWQEDDKGNLIAIRQRGFRGSKWEEVDLPIAKVWLNTWNRNGKNYAGFSAFRSVWYHMKLREQLLKLTGIALVREGAGIPTAYTTDAKAKLTKDQRAAFVRLLQNLVYHENASVIPPAGWKVEWIYSPAANKGHVVEAYNQLGLHILQQLGAQQLYLGTNSTGSRSVGEVHAVQAQTVVQGIIANLEAGLNGTGKNERRGLVPRMIDAVWGPQAKYPRVSFTLKKPKQTAGELADALAKGKTAGVFTPTLDDENTFREQCGLAPIEEEVRDAEKEKAASLAPPAPAGAFGEMDSKQKARLHAALRGSDTPRFEPRRALRSSEKVLELQAIAELFDDARVKFADGVRPLVAEMLMRALPAVQAAMADRRVAPEEISAISLDSKRLEAFIGKFLNRLRGEGYAHVKRELARRPLSGAQEDDRDTTPPAPTPPTPAEDTQESLAAMKKHLVRRMTQRLLSDVEREAIEVVRTEGAPEEVVARTLERQVNGGFSADAGLVVTKAFNMGRDEFAQELGDQVESVELSAILDRSTCGPCDRLDGSTFDFNSEEHAAHVPPLSSICDGGDSCRCLLVYNFKRDA